MKQQQNILRIEFYTDDGAATAAVASPASDTTVQTVVRSVAYPASDTTVQMVVREWPAKEDFESALLLFQSCKILRKRPNACKRQKGPDLSACV